MTPRREPSWLTLEEALALHDEQIELFGGMSGVLKRGALEASLARPAQVFAYDPGADLASLASLYLVGLINAHAFLDGNKRLGLAAMLVFLARHGRPLHVPPPDVFELVLGVATSRIREEEAAAWLRERLSAP